MPVWLCCYTGTDKGGFMIRVVKKPTSTAQITSAMTWWLTKRRLFKLDHYEISLLEIDYDRQSVKLLIKNTLTEEEEVQEQDLDEEASDI
jgi:hypothetical protein